MANSQFVFPEMRSSDDDDIRRDINEFFAQTPEIVEKPFTRVKQIEASIYGYRTLGTKDTIPRSFKKRIGQLLLRNPYPRPLEEQLVDYESERAGKSTPKPAGVQSQRFWFDSGDWFYENTLENEKPAVVWYHFTELNTVKLYNGLPVAFSEYEADSLVHKIEEYYGMVQDIYGRHPEYDLTE